MNKKFLLVFLFLLFLQLFDEAAGIVKFKRRKAIAQKKLEDEKQNLVRVTDILTELEKQVGPLAKQSEAAKEYLRLKEDLKKYDVNQFLLETAGTRSQLKEDVYKRQVLHGVTVQNSPSWNIHPYFSDDLRFLDLTILNPWDSPNTDGMDPESVNGLEIAGIYFSLGDDCIALKSGKYYMGHKYKVPSQNIEVRQCCMNNGHGAVTIGSEMAAGVKHVHVKDCLFLHTDRGLRIKTRRGRGKDAVIEDICFENIRMDHVLTPFVLNSYYNCCDPDCHSDYVKCKSPLPADERTPSVKQMIFRNIEAHNCHVAGAFIYGLPERKVDYVEFDHVTIDYDENPEPDEPAMMDDIQLTAKMGLYINNVQELVLNDVSISGCDGEPLLLENIDKITGNSGFTTEGEQT